MSESLTLVAPGRPVLEYLPVGLFGSVVGLTGTSVAWHIASVRYGAPDWMALLFAVCAVGSFVAVLAGYLVKLVTAPETVRAELQHPIASSLLATLFISLVLLPILIVPYARLLAQVMWSIGAAGMVVFAWVTVTRWLSNRQQLAHATPPWLIPVVGLLNVPIALPVLGLPDMHELMVLCLAVGLFFAVPLFTLVLSRLLFEAPMPDGLKPSLLVLVAPFAVGYSTYVATTGQTDLFAEGLYMVTMFLLAVLVGHLRNFARTCPFRVSWWAVSFPLAASSIAALKFSVARPGFGQDAIALLLLAFVTIINVALFIRTTLGVAKGELRHLST
jgi:tellurite resistance protein